MNKQSHMKGQKSAIFAGKNYKMNIPTIKKYHKTSDHCHYRASAPNICNLKYSILS